MYIHHYILFYNTSVTSTLGHLKSKGYVTILDQMILSGSRLSRLEVQVVISDFKVTGPTSCYDIRF